MKNIFYGLFFFCASASAQPWPSPQMDIQSVSFRSDTFSILDYNATSDAVNLNTKAINSAIQACHEHGGGYSCKLLVNAHRAFGHRRGAPPGQLHWAKA
jgi:hypothetical protein